MICSNLGSLTVVVMLCFCHARVIICQRLYQSGDVELNPGPLDQGSFATL